MRIISGNFRGKVLADVGDGDSAAHLRPTSDRVRESIFNLLVNGGYGDPINQARVLDLFAGTGALGLEALSRGAGHVSFVDTGAKALKLIKQNVELTNSGSDTTVLRRDACNLGPNPQAGYDLVFLDPPYGMQLGERAIADALANGWLTNDALVVWEENQAPHVPAEFKVLDQRKYGGTVVTILEILE